MSYSYALQRLDLVQWSETDGKLTVKTGRGAVVCPKLPEPDPGHIAVAGVFISPYPPAVGEAPRVEEKHVYPINPAPPAEPINPDAISTTLRKLRDGEDVSIAFLGDSITLGAEAGKWWADRSKTYTGRVMAGLKKRFPRVDIQQIQAWKGGITTKMGAGFFQNKVRPKAPDLLIIALGANDADGRSWDQPPRNPAPQFREDIRRMVRAAKQAGTEAMLVTPLHPHEIPAEKYISGHRQALLDVAQEENAACADVYADWQNLATRGIPPFTQLHNTSNHPGPFGHSIYAKAILRFFE